MALLAIAIPLLPGKTEQWTAFMAELAGPRLRQFEASREAMGVRERTFMQHTPDGDVVIVTLDGEDPASAFGSFGQGIDDFTRWFVSQVKDCHGIDMTSAMPTPLPHLLIDSSTSVRV